MRTLRIALAQINTTVGDLFGNKKRIVEEVAKARQMSANIVVFPELTTTGYPPEDLLLKKHFVNDNMCILKELAAEIKNIVAIIGYVDKDVRGLIYNAAAVIANGKVEGVYRKNRLPNYGVFDEKRYFTPGTGSTLFDYDGIYFGVSICEDIWHPQGPCADQAKKGASVLFNLSASPYHCGKTKQREGILHACAKKNKAFVCYCNLIGGQDDLVFDGSSVVFDSRGDVVARAKAFQEDLLVTDLKIEKAGKPAARTKAASLPVKPLLEGKLFIRGNKEELLSSVEEIYQALVLGTRDYMQKNHFKKAVIGISGGIDSALVAAIACDAVGRENVLGVSMPSCFTSRGTRLDAKTLARNLEMSFEEIPIKELFDTYRLTLEPVFKGLKPNIAEENIQARIRGNILMALSNKFGHLVLTTGNKSEISVGYCTLYGDMAGGFAVIKDVPKTTVYQLAAFVNKKAGWPLIPQSIIKRPPTAELKKNQKDEDSLPPYSKLDIILEAYIEKDQGLQEIRREKSIGRLAERIIQIVDSMEYKRRQAPIGVKITPKAFGRDRRLPLTNHYKEQER